MRLASFPILVQPPTPVTEPNEPWLIMPIGVCCRSVTVPGVIPFPDCTSLLNSCTLLMNATLDHQLFWSEHYVLQVSFERQSWDRAFCSNQSHFASLYMTARPRSRLSSFNSFLSKKQGTKRLWWRHTDICQRLAAGVVVGMVVGGEGGGMEVRWR